MRKSSLILLFVVQLTALFVLQNIYSLMKGIEDRARRDTQDQALKMADFGMAQYKRDPQLIKSLPFFESVTTLPQKADGHELIKSEAGMDIFIIRKTVSDNLSLVFSKALDSPLIDTISKLRGMLLWLNILLATFLLFTAIYLIYRLKKDKGEEVGEKVPPLQNYLMELKNAQHEMQQFLDEQNRTTEKKEQLNKNIINNLHLAVILVNAADQIEIFNPAAENIFSRSLTMAKNSRLADILNDFPELFGFIAATAERSSRELEAGSKTFYVDLIPLADLGKLVLIRDISEEKKLERIQRLNANLLSLGEMTASLAHEIKNSLGTVYGYARMLKEDKEKAAKIIDEIHFLTQMMENFLNFAKPLESLNWQPCDLKKMLPPLAASGEVALALPPGSMALTADPILLNRIFSNLILNAQQAGARQVTIRFERKKTVDIVFADNGSGIEEKNREKIWLPFFSTKDKGTGMGLPLVKKMVNALNGDIQLLHSDARGTAFLLSFYPH